MMINLLYYGVPSLVIAVTIWVGFLGWRFYVQNVLRDTDSEASDATQKTP
jgi:hypothetical protein